MGKIEQLRISGQLPSPKGVALAVMEMSRREEATLDEVARGNLYFVPPDIMQRHTPRLLDGAERLCTHLEAVRGKRAR